jgi:hypothetical protein
MIVISGSEIADTPMAWAVESTETLGTGQIVSLVKIRSGRRTARRSPGST